MWFLNRSNTNRAVQAQKMARGWNFGFKKKRQCTLRVAKTKALISFVITAKLICVFFFFFFSHMQMVGFLMKRLICCLLRFLQISFMFYRSKFPEAEQGLLGIKFLFFLKPHMLHGFGYLAIQIVFEQGNTSGKHVRVMYTPLYPTFI